MVTSVLNIDSVQLAYNGRKILQDVHLQCKTGDVIGILGRNGCGKSSLLKIIFGTVKADYKYLNINGNYIKKGYLNNRVGYLPQFNYLPPHLRVDKLARCIVDPELWVEFTEEEPFKAHGYKKPRELSGGELRQLETLIILYSKADFILLDEPFTHISPVQADAFKVIIRKRATTKGIIITDHQYYNIMEVSDRIILIDNGCTKHINNPDELVTYGYLSGINQ
jgi:lipopolysaccharide export system ATP-binding protein